MIDDRPSVLHDRYDVVVAGAGPAGLGAAIAARAAGAERILVVDREAEAGGILLQCIHSGFGLHHFGEELTGPEYAQRVLEQALDDGVDVLTDAYVLDIAADRRAKVLSGQHGVSLIDSGATVLAMGARERTRQAIRIPGSRPAGVLTAGAAQRLVNLHGVLPGRRVVILGSGDIGLIMARRLVLEGVDVAGVFELMPHANGLGRNIVQCLHDFDIPLHLSTTVTEIHGRDRVDGVTVAPVDEHLRPIADKSWQVPCDTLLVSIGLIPENELSRQLRLRLDPTTAGPVVTSSMETSRDGVFACGNVVHIHDLVDFVSAEAELAGRSAGLHAVGRQEPIDNVRLLPSTNVTYCVPHTISTDREHTVYLRVRRPLEKSVLRLRDLDGEVVHERKLRYVVPAEMVTLRLRPGILERLHGGALRVEVEPAMTTEPDTTTYAYLCIGCPLGCRLELDEDAAGEVVEVRGAGCRKGERYAQQEHTDPRRTLTTTVAIDGGLWPRLPVKSIEPMPRDLVTRACAELSDVRMTAPVRLGDVVVPDLLGTGIELVATRGMPAVPVG